MNDGKPILPSIPFTGASTNVSLYLLNWEECLPLERRTKREQCTAEELELSLPRLPELTKPTGKPLVDVLHRMSMLMFDFNDLA